jgi:hypothetical protein
VIPYTNDVHVNKNVSSNYSLIPMIKDYIVVWLDLNIDLSNEIHQNVIKQLRQIIKHSLIEMNASILSLKSKAKKYL